MELELLVRGQSNAYLLLDSSQGVARKAMVAELQQLLGFDGVNDTVSLKYSWWDETDNSIFPGSGFIGNWVSHNGDGWINWTYENAVLNYAREHHNPSAAATAVLWFHSETDSTNATLTADQWMSAVRFDAAQMRTALGGSAATIPYVFVSAIPFDSSGGDRAHQPIRVGMEELAADPNFNASIGARAQDINMSNPLGYPVPETYGLAHADDGDLMVIAHRIALSMAEEWAQYAKPGSPVANAGGNIDNLGPQVVSAQLSGSNALVLRVAQDHASGFQSLDPDAAGGVGWSVRSSGGVVNANRVEVLSGDTLKVTFDGALPADGVVYYGYGYGRLAGYDQPARGNAVYDTNGMPIWVAAKGLAIGATVVPVTSTPTDAPTANPAGNASQQAVLHDFNGDGTSDLLWRNDAGMVADWQMRDGHVAGSANLGSPGPFWTLAGSGDLDGDRVADLIWRGADGAIAGWEIGGTGVKAAAAIGNPGAFWTVAGVSDMSGDGVADLLLRGGDGSVAAWTMNGLAVQTATAVGNPGLGWSVAALRDFDGDQSSDILWRAQDGTLALWSLKGGTVAGTMTLGAPGSAWAVAGTGDFDADGRADILLRGADGSLQIWMMGSTMVKATAALGNPGTFWSVAGVGDYTGDGQPDILWRGADGSVTVWAMQGSQFAESINVGTVGQDWHLVGA